MKVKRLIQELRKFNPEAEVIVSAHGKPVIFVLAYVNDDKTVILETEEDCDMAYQLSEHFKDASDTPITDELDFYTDLLEGGVDVDCVRRYMGDEAADHMYDFCVEHGLI